MPRNVRYATSGPTHKPIAYIVSLSFGKYVAFADTIPIIASECPLMYLVPAQIERSTPLESALKKNGVAQLLSINTATPLSCAIEARPRTSCISNDCEPGASRNIARVFDRICFEI